MSSAPPPRPRKRLGQHFLIDHNIVRKIIARAELDPDETVLEIGPGCGMLTQALCETGCRVLAVEVDPRLVAYLKTHAIAKYQNLDLRTGDALEFPYETLPQGTVVVANLPYYLSTPLLFRLLDARAGIHRMILMLQLEVAQRLVAKPGTREYGALSVLGQYFATSTLAFRIAATCFRPRPDVDSAVVHLVMRHDRSSDQEDEAFFREIVRAAFAHRRKTLSNSLRDAGFALSDIHNSLARAGIDPVRRAETLTVQEFMTLAKSFTGSKRLSS